ncbi:N-6 DNA methylase [Candidatus Aminicenantes bacterium AC-334-K16]|jgi:hypothetical protein|nr:N-6 DNA methylase [Candidatus Aminicenantes bacterium AC-334-K16]
MKTFPAVRIEGGLFAPDLLDLLLTGELPGQRPQDFGLTDRRHSLTDEIAAIFADAQALWQVFQHRLERLPDSDPATSITRNFISSFLGLLGYDLIYNPRAYREGNLTFAISHRAGEAEYSPPVHIVGVRQELGRLSPSGRPRLAPHSLLQEFLNRTEALWGLVTNGKVLRLLRDSTYIRRQCYLEFDLVAIFEQQLFQDFTILYRLLHRTRLPKPEEEPSQCFLEQYYQYSVEQGGRVRERLRDGVEACLKRLANGFLAHPDNEELRRRVNPGADDTSSPKISPEDFYRQLLRLVYRFLFLFVSEDRGLISNNPLYQAHYGVSRLRRVVDQKAAYSEHEDIWHSLRVLWKILATDKPIQQLGHKPLAYLLGTPVLNGQLFEPIELDAYSITNNDLLEALWWLINYQEKSASPPRRINYAALDTEELGSVYESLLEYHPYIDVSSSIPRFELVFGSERKSTGSYYTTPELVAELIHSALDPVIKEKLKDCSSTEEKEKALLSIKVCDPACGSGHFLLAAARRLGKELARIRTGEEEPAPELVREAIRDVIAHCIYGVDKNPLAMELCRVALWLEAHCEGKPLTFLDHRIRCGDSLVGVFDLGVLKSGIPDSAFKPVSGDNKDLAKILKRKNQEECQGQMLLDFEPIREVQGFSTKMEDINRLSDDAPEVIHYKKKLFVSYKQETERDRTACDIWTAAFFQLRRNESAVASYITSDTLRRFLETGLAPAQAVAQAKTLAEQHRFFHWPLEFPEVFAQGGFDVVLGNPPWERIKLQEKEFFAFRDPKIARAPNAASRKKLIKQLPKQNPKLWEEYCNALHASESATRFLRESGLYPFTGRGDINTYSVFTERMRWLLCPGGRAGVIVPTGIATDDTNKYFFADLVDKGALVSLYDFENREGLFPGVHRSYKFCLLIMEAPDQAKESSRQVIHLAFFCTRAEHLHDNRRSFELSPEDIARINPNTRTLPVFRTRQDAELTRSIYERIPVLVNEREGENPWGVRFMRMFDMSNDSHLFRTANQLESAGFQLAGNRFLKGSELYLPLYEAKMIWHYDHRFGTYEGVDSRSSTHLPTPNEHQHADPAFLAQPWYWVPAEEVENRLGKFEINCFLCWRKITNATNERSSIWSVLPFNGAGDSLCLCIQNNFVILTILVSNVSSLIFDYITRQKIGGINLSFGIVNQLAALSPSYFDENDLNFIIRRVIELSYTSWDIKKLADNIWREADDKLKKAIFEQWEENKRETGGHTWELPDWMAAYPEIETDPAKGIPFPPFKWNERRRARLKAELDAYYAHLYGITRKQLRYILDPADLTKRELKDILDPWEEVSDPLNPSGYDHRVANSDFPGETFRVLKEKEISQYGEYRTRRLILEAWERLVQDY